MSGKFELKQSTNKQYFFHLKAGNGEIILSSELYTTKASAENGIQSVKTNAPIDSRYDCRNSTSNQPYFVLKAANYEIIGTSEMYTSTSARDNGIESVKQNAPNATIDDQT
jgi:uncharacterized protein